MAYRLPGGISAGFAQGQLGTGLPGGGEDGRMLVDNGASQLQLQQLMHMQGLPTSSLPLTLAALNGNVNLAALQEGAAGAGGAGAANASGNSLSRLLQLQGGSLAAAQEQQHQGVDHDSQYKQQSYSKGILRYTFRAPHKGLTTVLSLKKQIFVKKSKVHQFRNFRIQTRG